MSHQTVFYSNCYSYSFSPILTQLGTCVLCANSANTHKTVEQIFEILLLKFFADLKKITFKLQSRICGIMQQRSYVGRQALVVYLSNKPIVST